MSSTSNIDTTQSHSTPSSPSFRHVDDEIQIGSVVVTSTPQLTKLNHQVVSSSATPQVTSSGSPSTTSHSESTLTPPPRSPGSGSVLPANITAGDLQTTEKTGETSRVSLSRKESYKAQRQHYREEKARVTSALLHSIDDPSVVVLSDWLKVRGTLKSWTKLWCVLKPGVLLLYKSSKAKSSHWVGTVLLTSCRVIERPSKKDGFCFKLYHPLEQSIWAPRGPHNETLGAVIQPLPTAHLIFRAPSQSAGHRWLDSLELALQCNDAMLRCSLNESRPIASFNPESYQNSAQTISHDDLEKHFNEHELDSVDVTESDSEMSANGQPATTPRVPVDEPDTLSVPERVTGTGASVKLVDAETQALKIIKSIEEFYTEEEAEEIVASGEIVEEIAEENKSLLWFLIKQVRPGMDLSKVVLPTFILEPRSFLDKLADNYYHADILAEACTIDDPYTRFKKVLKWYLSGLYKKPKGLKKPYNPVLGEVFRCYWDHTKTGSKTYYVAEQVSHHPPVSAFYVSNRKEGFVIEGSLLAKSKFYGNSTAAILDGVARVVLTSRNNETYITSAPYAQCKGIVIGTLSMELGGKVTVNCVTTGYKADIDFKIRSFLGSSDQTNGVYGHITYGKKTVATLDGYWDGRIDLREKKGGEESVLMDVETLKRVRLKRHLVKLENQEEFESQRLWNNVSIAIHNDDQVAATDAKTIIEEAQRERARNAANLGHRLFDHSAEPIVDDLDGSLIDLGWRYKHANFGAWDMETEVLEYEKDFVIRSLYKQGQAEETRSSSVYSRGPRSLKIRSDTDSTEEIHHRRKYSRSMKATLHAIDDAIREQTMAIEKLSTKVNEITATQKVTPSFRPQNLGRVQQTSHSWDLFAGFILAIILQALLNWLFLH